MNSFTLTGFRGTLEKPDQWEKEVTQELQDHLESMDYLVQLEKKGQRSDFHLQIEIPEYLKEQEHSSKFSCCVSHCVLFREILEAQEPQGRAAHPG